MWHGWLCVNWDHVCGWVGALRPLDHLNGISSFSCPRTQPELPTPSLCVPDHPSSQQAQWHHQAPAHPTAHQLKPALGSRPDPSGTLPVQPQLLGLQPQPALLAAYTFCTPHYVCKSRTPNKTACANTQHSTPPLPNDMPACSHIRPSVSPPSSLPGRICKTLMRCLGTYSSCSAQRTNRHVHRPCRTPATARQSGGPALVRFGPLGSSRLVCLR